MQIEYKSQPLKQNWDQELPKYWFDGSPLKTHYLNGFSLLIPVAEHTVIHTIKETQKDLSDPVLVEQINEMIAQENWHSFSHRKYNEWLARTGYPAPELAADFMANTLQLKKQIDKRFGERAWLPLIVSGEHNAAIIMEYFLERPAMLATMHPHFRQAWVWHFIEEIEHKGSSMDMWNDTKILKNRKRSNLNLIHSIAGIRLNYLIMKNMVILLKHDKQLWKWQTFKDAWHFFVGGDGLITKTFLPLVRFFKPNFHPWDHDTRYLIEQYRKIATDQQLTEEQTQQIDAEFQGCVADIENVIRANNIKEY